jgi:hypothetical protein
LRTRSARYTPTAVTRPIGSCAYASQPAENCRLYGSHAIA